MEVPLTHTDAYEELGELHDLFMASRGSACAGSSRTSCSTWGAGTGMGTRALVGVTRAKVVALEPSRTMRAALTAPSPDSNCFVSEHEVHDGDQLPRAELVAGSWEPVGDQDLRRGLAATGLTARPHDPDSVLLRAATSP